MNIKIIQELREWKRNHYDSDRQFHGSKAFDGILSRAEAEQGDEELREAVKHVYEEIMLSEDNEYDDAESVAVKLGEILIDRPTPTPDKYETLAVLADRKGSWIEGWYKIGDMWRIRIESNGKDGSIVFRDECPSDAEAKAKEYLNGLEDK